MVNREKFKVQSSTLNVALCTSHSGFTLVELLVSILLTSIILGAIYSVYRVQTHSVKAQESRLEAEEYARAVLDMMVREIRNAGYNPLGAVAGTNCGGAPLAGAPGVVTANDTTFRFTYDFQGVAGPPIAPDGNCDDADEDITYAYVTGCAPGLGDVTRNGAALTDCNVTSFSLTYYAKDCTNNFSTPVGGGAAACPATPGGNAGTLAAIQRVSIAITVQSKNTEAGFGGGTLNATVTSNADLRNRGLPS